VQELRRRFEAADRVFIPAGIGGHVDHLFTRDAAVRARLPGQSMAVYGDYGYNVTQDWEESSRLSQHGVLPHQFVSLALPEAWVRRKQAMVACYPSQAESFTGGPPLLEPHLLAVEWYAELPDDPAPVEPWARPYRDPPTV
jgi:hypothetical protein